MHLSRFDIARFFRELRRRKVFRVAIGYGAAAWVIIEVSDTILPVLGAPESAFPLIVALAILGFPVAMVLAWAFDITPEGVQRTADLPPAPRRAPPPDACSIAALPFVDRSPDADHQYLADGITEEIINGLARLRGYRVVGRTSAFAFRGREADARVIGDALGVACLVEGSLRVHGQRMRLHVQMVETADGYASWSETFDRSIDDIFALQEDIARSIVGALEGRARPDEAAPGPDARAAAAALGATGQGSLIERSTSSFAAYDLYLRGRVHWSERSPGSLRSAIAFFRDALAEDPDFAHAHAGLADCYAVLLDYGLLAPAEALDLARHHAAEALRLAPDLAEAHGSTAIVAQIEWRWTDSEQAFQRALELNPGYAVAHHRYALLLAWQGRFEEARAAIARGLQTDPLSPAIAAAIGWIHYFARDFNAAIQAEREALDRFPGLGLARISLGLAQLARNDVHDAIDNFQSVLDIIPDSEVTADGSSLRSLLALAFARAGRHAEAERLIAILESGEPYASSYYRALPFIGLGRTDDALDRLEQAVEERCPQLIYIGTEPILDPLRGEPRFRRILETIGLAAQTPA